MPPAFLAALAACAGTSDAGRAAWARVLQLVTALLANPTGGPGGASKPPDALVVDAHGPLRELSDLRRLLAGMDTLTAAGATQRYMVGGAGPEGGGEEGGGGAQPCTSAAACPAL